MGGHPYWYFVPYESDVQHALDALRDREFKAGRYNRVIRFLEFGGANFLKQKPGAKHRDLDAAVEAAAEDGTRSILDISRVGQSPDGAPAEEHHEGDCSRPAEQRGTTELN